MKKIKIFLEDKLSPHHIPFIWGQEKEIFAGKDFTIELIEPDIPGPSFEVLKENNPAFALTNPLPLLNAYLSGESITSLARIASSQAGFYYRSDGDLQSPSDLSNNHQCVYRGCNEEIAKAMLTTLAEDNSQTLNFKKDQGQGFNRLLNGDIDLLFPANLIPEGMLFNLQSSAIGCWFFSDTALPENGDLILLAEDDLVDNQPNMIQNFITALHKSAQEVISKPEEAEKLFTEKYPDKFPDAILSALFQASQPALTTEFPQNFNIYTRWGEWLNKNTSVKNFLDLDRLIDERFLPFDLLDF